MKYQDKKNVLLSYYKVMQGIDKIVKDETIGSGRSSYQAVSDVQVKEKIRDLFVKHGLVLVPRDGEYQTKTNTYIDKYDKQKNITHTHVRTQYDIVHVESGESLSIRGLGEGVDMGDKSAGKATTYALKNALLYSFLVVKSDIDDTDKTHSDNFTETVKKKFTDDDFEKVKQHKEEFGTVEEALARLSKRYTIAQNHIDKLKKLFGKEKNTYITHTTGGYAINRT